MRRDRDWNLPRFLRDWDLSKVCLETVSRPRLQDQDYISGSDKTKVLTVRPYGGCAIGIAIVVFQIIILTLIITHYVHWGYIILNSTHYLSMWDMWKQIWRFFFSVIMQRLHCVNGDRHSQWRMANFDLLQNRNPWTIDIKLDTSDYVWETMPCTKYGANPSTGDFWTKRWNITLLTFYFFIPFFFNSPPDRPLNGFWRATAQKMRFHARMCHLGAKKLQLIFIYLCPKVKLWQKIFGQKCFAMLLLIKTIFIAHF